MGSTFRELWDDPTFLSPERKAAIEFEVSLIGKFIEAREKRGITQQKLAELSGVKQSSIARLERNGTSPQIDTLFRLLAPLGYKLDIVPMER